LNVISRLGNIVGKTLNDNLNKDCRSQGVAKSAQPCEEPPGSLARFDWLTLILEYIKAIVPWHLGHKLYFFRNAEILQNKKISQTQFQILWKKVKNLFEIFWNVLFFKIKSSKLINYLTGMCWSCPLYYKFQSDHILGIFPFRMGDNYWSSSDPKGTYALLLCWSSAYVISIRLCITIASMTQNLIKRFYFMTPLW
jgi:hypothetical protein